MKIGLSLRILALFLSARVLSYRRERDLFATVKDIGLKEVVACCCKMSCVGLVKVFLLAF